MTGTPFRNRMFHSLEKCTVLLWLWLGLRCADCLRVTMWVIHTLRASAHALRMTGWKGEGSRHMFGGLRDPSTSFLRASAHALRMTGRSFLLHSGLPGLLCGLG